MRDLLSAAFDFILISARITPEVLIGLAVGLLAGFLVWCYLHQTEFGGLAAGLTFIVTGLIVSAVLDNRK